jgi:hypothetical protein
MNPKHFQLTLVIMAFLFLVVFSFLFYGVFAYREAVKMQSCQRDFYARAEVEGSVAGTPLCTPACSVSCEEKGADGGVGLVLSETRFTESESVMVSCLCTCQSCIGK